MLGGSRNDQIDFGIGRHGVLKIGHGFFTGGAVIFIEHIHTHTGRFQAGQDTVTAVDGNLIAGVQRDGVDLRPTLLQQILTGIHAADHTAIVIDRADPGDIFALIGQCGSIHQEYGDILFVGCDECLGQRVAVPACQNQSVDVLIEKIQAVIQLGGGVGGSVGCDAGTPGCTWTGRWSEPDPRAGR